MPRTYQRTSTRGSWDVGALEAAIAAAKEGMPLLRASKTFGIPRNTLRGRLESGDTGKRLGPKLLFTAEQERELEKHLLDLDTVGFGLNLSDLRRLAYQYATENGIEHRFNNDTKMAGYDWVYGFLERHPKLSIRKAEGLSYARARGINKGVVDNFFRKLSEQLDTLSLWEKPARIFNADESGCQLIYKPGKVISQKGKKDVYAQTTGEKGETVTVMACSNATGQFIPPFVIMKGSRKRNEYATGMPPGTKVVMSDSGYMKVEQFSLFIDHLAEHKPEGDIILLVDGHGTHTTDLHTLEKARAKGIHILCLPAHATDKMQPLDVSFFRSMKLNYNENCCIFVRSHPGVGITKASFGEIFCTTWNRSAEPENGSSGFAACGIFPYDPAKFDDEVFAPGTFHA